MVDFEGAVGHRPDRRHKCHFYDHPNCQRGHTLHRTTDQAKCLHPLNGSVDRGRWSVCCGGRIHGIWGSLCSRSAVRQHHMVHCYLKNDKAPCHPDGRCHPILQTRTLWTTCRVYLQTTVALGLVPIPLSPFTIATPHLRAAGFT